MKSLSTSTHLRGHSQSGRTISPKLPSSRELGVIRRSTTPLRRLLAPQAAAPAQARSPRRPPTRKTCRCISPLTNNIRHHSQCAPELPLADVARHLDAVRQRRHRQRRRDVKQYVRRWLRAVPAYTAHPCFMQQSLCMRLVTHTMDCSMRASVRTRTCPPRAKTS